MDIKIQDIEFPAAFIRDVLLEDNKLIVSLPENRILEFIFTDNKSAKTEYNKITSIIKSQ